jgi:hypothetical protein
MKTTRLSKALGAALLSTAFIYNVAPRANAAQPTYPNINYNVTLNLSALASDANAPFSLDFQLESGSGNATNTVTLSNFVFTGGSATGSPDYTSGNESGSLSSTLTLTTSTNPTAPTDNEFAQAITAGVTQVSFSVSQTRNPEVVTTGTPIPDQFNVAVLDSNFSNVPTTDPSGAASDTYTLVSSAITVSETPAQVDQYTLAAVPEPSTYVMLLGGLLALGASLRLLPRRA